MSTLDQNLGAMADQGIPAPIESPDAPRVRVEEDQHGVGLSMEAADGRWVTLQSRRAPGREAERLLADALRGSTPPVLMAVGLGLGYLLDALDALSPHTKVIALEPLPGAARALLERRDLTARIRTGRLWVLTGPNYAGASRVWRSIDPDGEPPPVVVHPVLARELPEATQRARELAGRIVFGAKANAEARRKFGGRYLLNTLANLPVLAADRDVAELFDRFTGVPAILVAAGPSLDRNIPELREVGDRALVISVDTALRPLLVGGVSPHLVVSVDAQPANARHLLGLPAGHRARLVSEGSVDPAAFADFHGRSFTFRVSDHAPWDWLRREGVDRGVLATWGSVLTSALDLALRMGCNPVVFAGADLAFTGNRPYCRNTVYESDWAEESRDRSLEETWERWIRKPTIDVPGVNGENVRTGRHLVAFRDWLVERSVLDSATEFINATGAGLLAGGRFVQGSLRQATSRGRRPDLTRLSAAPHSDLAERLHRAAIALRHGDDTSSTLDRWAALGLEGASRTEIEQILDQSLRALVSLCRKPSAKGPGSL